MNMTFSILSLDCVFAPSSPAIAHEAHGPFVNASKGLIIALGQVINGEKGVVVMVVPVVNEVAKGVMAKGCKGCYSRPNWRKKWRRGKHVSNDDRNAIHE